MAKETRPSLTYKWAQTGTSVAPADAKVQLGWVAEKPSFKYVNYIENRQDQALAYLYQQGIPEWDSGIEYQSGTSFVSYAGNLYVSIQTGTNKQPDTQTAYWKLYGKKFVAAPATASSTGSAGDWAVDSDYIYVCVASNTWKRAAISTW